MTKRKRRTTVGSIRVPELPWKRPRERAAARHADPKRDDYCQRPGHDQVGCDCDSPFNCT